MPGSATVNRDGECGPRRTRDTLAPADRNGNGGSERDRRFLLTRITHAGINNLPKEPNASIAARLHEGGADLLEPWVDGAVRAQVVDTGYANSFEAIRSYVPWRPALAAADSTPLQRKPLAFGVQTATVVGAAGERTAQGGDEIHTDALGRIRIQFHFQTQAQQHGPDTSIASTWVRVLQRYAGAGMGLHFIPRIGQEVLVEFIEGDIDRPLVIGALYNGQGDAGSPATPGGRPVGADTAAFGRSGDHAPSAQGNLAGGNSPAWHGASPEELEAQGQRNAAALSGFKTKEFGGAGYNQLVFDDSNQQLRTQAATTQHASQLNLGHLVHQADNHRGSFRGLGFELRTDAYGVVRARSGVLLSSYGTSPSEPAGDNAAGIALANQLKTLAATFSGAARTHETVQLAAHIGSDQPGQSALDPKAAPLTALHVALKGMVSHSTSDQAQSDAAAKNNATEAERVPHLTDPIVVVAAKAGLAVMAGQDVHLAAAEGVTLASGNDTDWAVGGALRIHSGQALGMLAGAVKPGEQAAGTGLTVIAAKGHIDVQAQADLLQVAAKNDVSIQSASEYVDLAAAKKITMSTAAGANITIEGGNITVQCPGKIAVRAGVKSFVGPERADYRLPSLPMQICLACLLKARKAGARVSIA